MVSQSRSKIRTDSNVYCSYRLILVLIFKREIFIWTKQLSAPFPLPGPFIIGKVAKTDLIFSKLGFFIVLENIKTIMRLVRSRDCAIAVVFFNFFFSTSSFSWNFFCFFTTFLHSKSTLVWM